MNGLELRRALVCVCLVLGSMTGAAQEQSLDPDDLFAEEGAGSDDSFWPGGLDAFVDHEDPVYQGLGTVNALEYPGPVLVVDGLVFDFAPWADVQFASGGGAPTLMAQGMEVEFYFTENASDALAGTIIALIEVPENVVEPE